jgi:hypothetical protein
MTSTSAPVIAVIDETSPEDRGGIYYVVTAAVLLNAKDVVTGLNGVVPTGRQKPFHWAKEGTRARQRMLDLIVDSGVVAHVVVHYPTGRRRQEEARRLALRELLPLVVAEGAEELVIESRSDPEDQRDRGSVIEALRQTEGATITYRWEPKAERVLWVADAICGAVKEYLLKENEEPLNRLRGAGVLTEPQYRNLPRNT